MDPPQAASSGRRHGQADPSSSKTQQRSDKASKRLSSTSGATKEDAKMIGQWRIGRTIGKGSSGTSFTVFLYSQVLNKTLFLSRPRQDCQTLDHRQIRSNQDRTQGTYPELANVHVRSRRESRQGPFGHRARDRYHEVDRPSKRVEPLRCVGDQWRTVGHLFRVDSFETDDPSRTDT